MRRSFHLGLDYGTSASKLVLRELDIPGGTRAHVVSWNGSYRIPSTVAFNADTLSFVTEDAGPGWQTLTSVKMHAAKEAKGQGEPCPVRGLGYGDIVVLSLWWLLSHARREAARIGRVDAPHDVELGFTLGIPTSFLDDPILRQAFLGFAGLAGRLERDFEPLSETAYELDSLIELMTHVRATHPHPERLAPEHMVQAESKAALWWALKSPTVPIGPYVEVDLGAGTTHASFFRLTGGPATGKDGIHVFGAVSVDVGMDDVGRRLLANSNGTLPSIRGREADALRSKQRVDEVRAILDAMYRALEMAWSAARTRLNLPPETGNWGAPGLAFAGGGSLVTAIVNRFMEPSNWLPCRFSRVDVGIPTDLHGARATRADMAFLQVAYGLSDDALEFITLNPPGSIVPMSRGEAPDALRCLCLGSNDDCPRCGGKGIVYDHLMTGFAPRSPASAVVAERTTPRPRTAPRMRAARQDFIRCPQCQKEVTADGLELHIRDSHLARRKVKAAPMVKCPKCDLQVLESALSLHLLRHEREKEPAGQPAPERSDRLTRCRLCGAPVASRNLRKHLEKVHAHFRPGSRQGKGRR